MKSFINEQASIKNALQFAVAQVLGENGGIEKLRFVELKGEMSFTRLYTFRVKGNKYVLRIMSSKRANSLIKNEITAHKLAANLGVAPELTYADSEVLIMIMPFIIQPLRNKLNLI